jgi:hypothetical protein
VEENGPARLAPDGAGASSPGTGAGIPAEPDFTRFEAHIAEPVLPRWLRVALLWLAGVGVLAAVTGAGIFVAQERAADMTLELVATQSRVAIATPQIAQDLPARQTPAQQTPAQQTPAEQTPAQQTPAAPAPVRQTPAQIDPAPRVLVGDNQAATGSPRQPSKAGRSNQAKGARPTATPGKKAAPVRAKAKAKAKAKAAVKPALKKKRNKRKKAAALARHSKKYPAPPRRTATLAERVKAAVAACRARPHAPGECNVRACDVAGKSDPACR